MEAVTENWGLWVDGFARSLGIIAWSGIGALVLGTLVAVARVSPIPILARAGTLYVSTFRNTPLAVLLFFIAFGIPAVGVNASFYVFGVAGLIIYTAAFVCEALRGGINSVPPGQAEAARAIGLGFGQSLTLVVLPQALRTVVPPVGNVLIAMMKNSALVGAAGVGGDLYSAYNRLTSAQGYAFLPTITGMAIGYLVITLTAGLLLALAERRLAVAR